MPEDTAAEAPPPQLAPPSRNLTNQQKLFVLHYSIYLDERKAAEESQIHINIARRFLRDPKFSHVQRAIEEACEEKRKALKVEAQTIVTELAKIAFSNPKRMLNDEGELKSLRDLPDDVAVTIKKFKVSHRVGQDREGNLVKLRCTEIEFWNKLEALKQLGQHLGLLKEQTVVNNVLQIDWAGLMGKRRPALTTDDPLEERIAAAAGGKERYLTANGDPVSVPETIQGGHPPLPCALRELEEEK